MVKSWDGPAGPRIISDGAGDLGCCQRKSADCRSWWPVLGSAACGVRQWKMITSPGLYQVVLQPGSVPVSSRGRRDLGQREPGGQHVLDSRPHAVAVDVPAAGLPGCGLRRHCAQYLHRVRESLRAQDAADRLAQLPGPAAVTPPPSSRPLAASRPPVRPRPGLAPAATSVTLA